MANEKMKNGKYVVIKDAASENISLTPMAKLFFIRLKNEAISEENRENGTSTPLYENWDDFVKKSGLEEEVLTKSEQFHKDPELVQTVNEINGVDPTQLLEGGGIAYVKVISTFEEYDKVITERYGKYSVDVNEKEEEQEKNKETIEEPKEYIKYVKVQKGEADETHDFLFPITREGLVELWNRLGFNAKDIEDGLFEERYPRAFNEISLLTNPNFVEMVESATEEEKEKWFGKNAEVEVDHFDKRKELYIDVGIDPETYKQEFHTVPNSPALEYIRNKTDQLEQKTGNTLIRETGDILINLLEKYELLKNFIIEKFNKKAPEIEKAPEEKKEETRQEVKDEVNKDLKDDSYMYIWDKLKIEGRYNVPFAAKGSFELSPEFESRFIKFINKTEETDITFDEYCKKIGGISSPLGRQVFSVDLERMGINKENIEKEGVAAKGTIIDFIGVPYNQQITQIDKKFLGKEVIWKNKPSPAVKLFNIYKEDQERDKNNKER